MTIIIFIITFSNFITIIIFIITFSIVMTHSNLCSKPAPPPPTMHRVPAAVGWWGGRFGGWNSSGLEQQEHPFDCHSSGRHSVRVGDRMGVGWVGVWVSRCMGGELHEGVNGWVDFFFFVTIIFSDNLVNIRFAFYAFTRCSQD